MKYNLFGILWFLEINYKLTDRFLENIFRSQNLRTLFFLINQVFSTINLHWYSDTILGHLLITYPQLGFKSYRRDNK